MHLTDNQKELTAKYFSDISKLIFAATVLGFFVQVGEYALSMQTMIVGAAVTVCFFVFSVIIRK